MPTAVISDRSSTSKRRKRCRIYGLRTFMDPGCPTDFSGAFRNNVRRFVRECADVEDYKTVGMPTWCTLLVDDNSGIVVPLYTVEESVRNSDKPFCDFCRCNGWSHHFVSKRRYHIIIPADVEWDRPLHFNAFNLTTHLLHGLLHCNGFGHLLLINGYEGGSKFIAGHDLMDLWDRLCTSLRVREVSVEDISRKYSTDLRLLFGIAYGTSWFSRWGYLFRSGSFGVNELSYNQAVETLSLLSLDSLLADPDPNANQLKHIIISYTKLTPLTTLRDLLCFLIDLRQKPSHTPPLLNPPLALPPPPKKHKKQRTDPKKCRTFASVAANLGSRWNVRRLLTSAQVVLEALIDCGHKMTRQEVRDAARLTIGDTGLIDFVLKSLGNTIVGDYVVHRKSNCNRVLEFSISKINNNASYDADDEVVLPDEDDAFDGSVDVLSVVKKDLRTACKCLSIIRPHETQVLLNAKHWGKVFAFRDEADDLLRFHIQWMPTSTETDYPTMHPLPPTELIVLDAYASIQDLKAEAESTFRDTYCVMESFQITETGGIQGERWEPVMLAGVESGDTITVRGELGPSSVNELLKYEGGADSWSIGCRCGARDDDGERMVACDACDVWHHTRCIGIEDDEPVPQLFLCAVCGSSILAAEEEEEEEETQRIDRLRYV